MTPDLPPPAIHAPASPTRQQARKPRKMFANYGPETICVVRAFKKAFITPSCPVLVIDLSPASVEAMHKKLGETLAYIGFNDESPLHMPIAKTILASLGIKAAKGGRK